MDKNEAIEYAIRSIGIASTKWVKEYLESAGCHIGSFDIISGTLTEDMKAIEILKGLKDDAVKA